MVVFLAKEAMPNGGEVMGESKSWWFLHKATVSRYVIAVLLVAVAWVLTVSVRAIYASTPHALFFCAILVAVWVCGLGPSVLAAILSSAVVVFFLPAPAPVGPPLAETIRFAVFLLAAVFIAFLTTKQKRTEEAFRCARDNLEEKVTDRTRQLSAANAELKVEIDRRQQTEALLRLSEHKLKEAQRIGKIGYWERDLVKNRINWSEETFKIFGLAPRPTGLSEDEFEHLIHPDDRKLHKQALQDALQGTRGYDVEYRIVTGDQMRFIHVRDEIEYDSSGKPKRMFGTVQDVTEVKLAEELLYARQEQFRVIVENARDYIICCDRDLRRTYANPAFVKDVGVPEGELIGTPAFSAIGNLTPTDEEFREATKALKQVVESGRPRDFDHTYTFRNGPRAFHSRIEPQFDAKGNVTGFVSIARDITERTRAEAALRESHHLLELVLSTLPLGVAVTDRQGDIILVNEASKRIWGADPIVLGQERRERSRGFWHDSGKRVAPGEWASVRAVTQGQTSLNEVIDIEAFDGRQKIIKNSAAPIRDAQGSTVGAVIVNEDVTEAKKGEEKLRQAEAELTRISRLTMLGELCATIAHEVNQPLAAVITNAHAAARWLSAVPPDLSEAQNAINHIARDGTLASEIIQRIRGLFKRQAPERTSVNLNGLICETAALFEHEICRYGIHFQTDLAPNLPLTKADPVQLQQVLLNLLMNAIESLKAIREGSRLLQVRSGLVAPELIEVGVHDTGIGIQDAARLFEPFYTTKPDGLGLGLSVSRSIVESHGGQISAGPNTPRGAIFHFTLPIQNGDNQ